LQVRNDADTNNAMSTFHYHLTSSRTITQIPEQGIEYRSAQFPAGWLERVYALLSHTLESTVGAQAADRHIRLALLGQYLFRSLLPTELQRTLRSLVDVGHTLLILSDQDAVFPWTLLHDGQAFLGEHFSIGRWLRELHDTRPYEFPVGVVSIAYYEGITKPEIWAEALAPPGAPEAVPLPGGLLNVGTTETIRGLHLLRAGKSSRATDLRDAPALLTQTLTESSIEQQVQATKFSLRSNHPLVTLSYLHAGISEITTLEQSWSSTFIRAGCSAFIGPLWAVQPTAEATFVSTFYARLWAGDALGDAFRAARELTRIVVPNSIDYLAYVLFGDPMARPYRPVEGDGYATVEPVGREMEDPVLPGTSARFRVSLRRRPPIWHEGRVIEVAQSLNFEHLKIYVVTFGLQVTPATPIKLMHTSTGDYVGWFSLSVPMDIKRTAHVVQVHFVDTPDPSEAGSDEFDEPEPIHSLRFTLPIEGGDGDVW
jgi:Peptidase family C25